MKLNLSKDSPIPLHIQLLNELQRHILSGELAPGSRITSEPVLQRELGVSRSTIRQAFNAARSEGLIETVAGKGTFVSQNPNRQQEFRLVGFVIPYFRSSFDTLLLRGAENGLKSAGFRVIFCTSDQQSSEEDCVLQQLHHDPVAGFLIWPVMSDQSNRYLNDLLNQGVPAVFMDRSLPNRETDLVQCDNLNGGFMAARHLVELGHRRVAFLGRPHLNLLPIAERLSGYQQAMQAAGLRPLEPLLFGEQEEITMDYALRSYTNPHGKDIQEISRYLASAGRATAIFTMNDLMAIQVLVAAEMAGVRVPHDLSVVGFDDLDFCSHLSVPLTTVAQDPYQLGFEAARLLLERIKNKKGGSSPRKIVLPTRLVVRASTAAPPPS